MLKCKQATQLMSEGQDRELTRSERFRLKLHLLMCSGCKNYNRHLKFIRKAMQKFNNH